MKRVLSLLLLFFLLGALAQEQAYCHLTYSHSQVGYVTEFPKNAMIQDADSGFLSSKATFTLSRIFDNKNMLYRVVEPQGTKWVKYW